MLQSERTIMKMSDEMLRGMAEQAWTTAQDTDTREHAIDVIFAALVIARDKNYQESEV